MGWLWSPFHPRGSAVSFFSLFGPRKREPLEAVPHDRLHQQAFRAGRCAHAHSDVKFPVRPEIHVESGHDLLLLLVQRVQVSDGPQRSVVLQAEGDAPGHVVADFGIGRELPAKLLAGAAKGFLHRGIERPIPLARFLVDDWPKLPRPRVGGKVRTHVAELGREAHAHRPAPLLRRPHSWTDVRAHELPSVAHACRAEQVVAGLEPRVPAVRDLQRLVERMVGRQLAVGRNRLAAVNREVAVQLHHGPLRIHRVAGIDLDFVVFLRAGAGCGGGRHEEKDKDPDCSSAHRLTWLANSQGPGQKRFPALSNVWQEPASGFRIRRFGDSANQTNHERYPPPAVRAAIIEPTDLPKETGSLPPSFKSLSALLAPGALLVAALVGLHVTAARPAVREFLDFYPYIVLVLGALLALRFHSSRSLFALAALALAARYSLPAAPAVTRGFVAVLLPMNLAAITCVRERGVLTPAAAVRIGTLACQAVLVSVLSRPEIAWTHWIAHPLLPWAAATLAGFMVLLRFVAVADPLTAAFLWCVPSYLVAQAANSTPMRNAVFATAGAVVLLGLVERGYRLAYHDALTGLPGR